MSTSHKLTRLFFALATLVTLAASSFAQAPPPIQVSDQKPGSLLVYPYYTSNAQTKADTRLTLTNIGQSSIAVHLFFLNGANCQQADQYVCLTKGASITFNASEQDPDITGYLIAVAVDAMGRPISYNNLIGNAFVNAGDFVGNYGAEAFASYLPQGVFSAVLSGDRTLAAVSLNGFVYDNAPDQFAVEIQSPQDVARQTIVHASLGGNIARGEMNSVRQFGTGLVVRGDEKQGSFVSFIGGNCQSVNTVTATAPRVPSGLGSFIPKGQIGTMVYNTSSASVGLLMTPKSATSNWSGIRTLHKTRVRADGFVIPVFMPVCGIEIPVGRELIIDK